MFMDTVISSAIAALVTAIITIGFPLFFDLMFPHEFNRAKQARSEAINGRWQGVLYQDEGPYGKPIEYKFGAILSAKGTAISGSATIDFNDKQYQLVLEGRFIDVYLVELSYRNIDPTVVHFGRIILELSSLGNEWISKFIGYGLLSRAIVSGTLECRRISR